MTTSQTPFLSEIADRSAVIPAGKLAYLESRARRAFHDYILSKFEAAREEGLTKNALAKRIGRDPAQVHRLLATPNNLTIDSVAVLLAGIAAEELLPYSKSLLDRPARNFDAHAFETAPAPVPETTQPTSINPQASAFAQGNFDSTQFSSLSAS